MHQRERCTACFVTLAPFILPEVISRSRAAHPYLNIEVDEVDAEEAREAIRAGRAELSVGYDLTYDGRQVAACRIADDVPALRVVIATLPGVRQTARAAALAEAIRGVFRDAASAGTAPVSGETAAAGPGPAS